MGGLDGKTTGAATTEHEGELNGSSHSSSDPDPSSSSDADDLEGVLIPVPAFNKRSVLKGN